jgi:hypothetical protein
MDFIGEALSKERMPTCQSFELELHGMKSVIEVVNYTDMDVEARLIDMDACHRGVSELVHTMLDYFLELLTAHINEELSDQERAEAQKAMFELTLGRPELEEEIVEMIYEEARDGIEISADGGKSRSKCSSGESLRAVILPFPEVVNEALAEEAYLAVFQQTDNPNDMALVAILKRQDHYSMSRDELSELAAILGGFVNLDDYDDAETNAIVDRLVKQVFPFLRYKLLEERVPEGARLLSYMNKLSEPRGI